MYNPMRPSSASKFLLRPCAPTVVPEPVLTHDSTIVPTPKQVPAVWQVRRAQFARIQHQIQNGDDGAQENLNCILAEFESKPLGRTPIENLDILGGHYIRIDGVEKLLPAIVINQVLGWYDALRFGTASGREEILSNEGFFKRVFVIAGVDVVKNVSIWMREQPDRVAAIVNEGLRSSDKFKDIQEYDILWPTVYGLERTIRALGGETSSTEHLPENEWLGAWHSAKRCVGAYYILSTPEST